MLPAPPHMALERKEKTREDRSGEEERRHGLAIFFNIAIYFNNFRNTIIF
jgi:hypothetical protein